MKRFSCIALVLSHVFLFGGISVCCVIEHYAWLKMGMYRYLVLKNSWWLKNVFTVETLPLILSGIIIIMLAVLYFYCRPVKSYCFSYGVLLISGSLFLFNSDYFFSLRAGPWFGLSLILSEAFFVFWKLISVKNV